MLSKLHRLRSDRDFKKVFAAGKVAENQYLRIKYHGNQEKFSRFGFVVSVKLAKKATTRNLIKRRLRAAIRFLLTKIKPGFDIVIWPKTPLLKDNKYQTVVESLKILLSKNDLLPF